MTSGFQKVGRKIIPPAFTLVWHKWLITIRFRRGSFIISDASIIVIYLVNGQRHQLGLSNLKPDSIFLSSDFDFDFIKVFFYELSSYHVQRVVTVVSYSVKWWHMYWSTGFKPCPYWGFSTAKLQRVFDFKSKTTPSLQLVSSQFLRHFPPHFVGFIVGFQKPGEHFNPSRVVSIIGFIANSALSAQVNSNKRFGVHRCLKLPCLHEIPALLISRWKTACKKTRADWTPLISSKLIKSYMGRRWLELNIATASTSWMIEAHHVPLLPSTMTEVDQVV